MQEAVSEWYHSSGRKRYLDVCQGPYCNEECPDEFVLLGVTSDNWPGWVKFLIIVLTVAVPIVCIATKGLFVAWLFMLERKQLAYLNSLYDPENGYHSSKLQVTYSIDQIIVYSYISCSCSSQNVMIETKYRFLA